MDSLFTTRRELFPNTTTIGQSAGSPVLAIGGCKLDELAEQYGTPLYLYDLATMDAAVARYRQALARAHPVQAGLTYAGKAFLCIAVAQWAQARGLLLDCTGIGELSVASAAGLQRKNLLVHGVNKGVQDLEAAVAKAGILVVDHLTELERMVGLFSRRKGQPFPDLWLRLRPGLAVDTHAYTQTGQEDSKFGMSASDFWQAVLFSQAHELPLAGLHFHLGSHFHDPTPLRPAIAHVLDLLSALRQETGWYPAVLSPGGGWGIPYHEEDLPHRTLEEYVQFVSTCLAEGCRERSLPLPHLQLEPGRSLVARAGVAIYRIGAIKRTPHRRWLLLDGGLSDNPRPALYGARYSALPVLRPERPEAGLAWFAGPYCESGDVLIEGLPMPEVTPGELVAVPASGAYHLSMASNYNGARRPAVILVENGKARLIQRRETLEDLYQRDLPF